MKLKPFSSIPGPFHVPFVGTIYKYFPIIGEFDHRRMHRTGELLYKKYGPLVKESILGRLNILHIFDPKDMETVYLSDGKYPHRYSHKPIEKYRLSRPEMYSSGGLLPTNGEEWWRIRQKSQALSKLTCIRSQIPLFNQIIDDFLEYADKCIDADTMKIMDYSKYVQMVILEASAAIGIDDRIRAYGNDICAEESLILRRSAVATTENLSKLDRAFPLWKWFNTATYKKVVDAQDAVYKIALKYVEAKRSKMKIGESGSENITPQTPLEHFLLDKNLTNQDVMTMIGDIIIAGVETTSYSMIFVLYHIARNLDKQEKLYEEVKSLLKDSAEITNAHLTEAKYAKAVIKEALRLNPISFALGREANADLVLGGYHVPKGTVLLTQHMVASLSEENFVDAGTFLPERWINKDFGKKATFAALPFGYGVRGCLGRRLAEMTLEIYLMKIIRKYEIRYVGNEKLDVLFKMVNMPDGPLPLEFLRRY